jgi:hypothetical protein
VVPFSGNHAHRTAGYSKSEIPVSFLPAMARVTVNGETTTMLRTAFACTIGLFIIGSAGAQSPQGVPGAVKNFVTQYVAATNAKDITRLRLFLYPKSLTCITPANKDYYDAMASHIGEPIPPNYKFSVMPVNEDNLKALESMGQRWTVKPAQELHIDYQQGDEVGGYVVYLIHENGRWFYDLPCAMDAAIKQYRDNAAANEAALAHYKALASEIKEPLRSELLGLLRTHETGAATDRYHQVTGQDYKTSMYVVNVLKTEAR